MSLVQFPRQSVGDVNGSPFVGAKAYFYQAGSGVLIELWTDSSYSIDLQNPVPSDSDGRFPVIEIDPSVNPTYKLVILDADGALIYNQDDLITSDVTSLVTQQFIGQTLYPRTDAERAGSITPVSIFVPSHEVCGYINPLRYMTGAQISDVVSNTAAQDVTSVLNACFAFGASAGIPVSIPLGTCKFTSGLTVPRCAGFTLFGYGQNSVLKASGSFSKAITIGDLFNQTIRASYRDFVIDMRSATVQYGIYGARVEEHRFTRVFCWGAATAGFSIGYGYVNDYIECEACYGKHGFTTNADYLGGANNTLNYTECLALLNTGLGFKITGGYGLRIDGCTVETCDEGGIWANVVKSIYIKAYFESNGLTGHAFTTPALTIKADIILVGSGNETDMSAAFATDDVVIEACNTVPRSGSTAFVWNAGASNLTVRNCYTSQPPYVPVVGEHYNNAYKGAGVRIEDCATFTTQITQTGATAATNNTVASYVTIRSPALNLPRRNFAQPDFHQWSVITSGSTTTWRRSTGGSTLYRFRNSDVWEINSGASGTSDILGFQLDAAAYPELNGLIVVYGLWMYSTNANFFAVPYSSAQDFNANPTTLSTWSLAAVTFTWPGSGTLSFGAFKSGSGTGSCYVAAPALVPIGVPNDEAISILNKQPKIWYGATPTAGAWERGDWVISPTPSAGGSPGAVCTTAGSPGTWKAMANVAA